MAILFFDSKTKDVITGAIAVGTGVLAWESQSTKQWAFANPQGYSLFSKTRMEDAISQTFGKGVTQALDPSYNGLADFHTNPFGVINAVSVGGGIALGISALLDDVGPYKHVKPYVDAAAVGALVGGAIGGFFDPPSAGPGPGGQPGFYNQNVQGPGVYQVASMQAPQSSLRGWSN